MKRCFDTASVRGGAEKISRKYNDFLISLYDKTCQCADGDKLMENRADKKKSELAQKEIIETFARGSPHPPRPDQPMGTKDHLTGYATDRAGKKAEALHLNTDGTFEEYPVPKHKQYLRVLDQSLGEKSILLR